ncbi:MAG: hypothetical protein Kow0032_18000 [Methyloligellaceae bacterium]
MKTIHTEQGIDAPAATVWALVRDLEGWERWNPIMKGSGLVEPGARPRITIAPPGRKPIDVRPKITHFVAGQEFRWRTGFPVAGLFRAEHGFRVVPESEGRCRFEQFEVMSGLLSGMIYARSGREIETGFQAMNRMLKREAERRARERD